MNDVLDFGCGRGRYLELIANELPGAMVRGCELSPVAVQSCRRDYPEFEVLPMNQSAAPFASEAFDLIACLEVIEHTPDAGATARELRRLLRPGGSAIVTTPCSNRGSGPWLYNALTRGFEDTPDGIGRFATDDPAHLRRLTTRKLSALLQDAGLQIRAMRWWSHGFTAVADTVLAGLSLPLRVRAGIARLDWRLFRRLPNGGAVVVVAERAR
ncbi:MAG: class I SAM-dependent methyltransferase [Solirubrobacterales bacterium]